MLERSVKRFAIISEADASNILENLKELFPRYLYQLGDHGSMEVATALLDLQRVYSRTFLTLS